MEQYSPVAISIAFEVHWNQPDVRHTGIEAILRKMLSVAYIIGGRKLAISIKRVCKRCRILNKNITRGRYGSYSEYEFMYGTCILCMPN